VHWSEGVGTTRDSHQREKYESDYALLNMWIARKILPLHEKALLRAALEGLNIFCA